LINTEDWKTFERTDRWGGRDKYFCFATQVTIPEEFKGETIVYNVRTGREADWDAVNPQFLVYVNGEIKQGFDVNHRRVTLTYNAVPGDVYSIILYAFSGMKEGLAELTSDISILNRNVERLYFDIKVPYDSALLLNKDDKDRIDLINGLNDAINMLDLRKPFSDEFNDSVDKTIHYLQNNIYDLKNANKKFTAYCVGHTHIDVAWLWTLTQTREKAIRSFSTVLSLMDQYPDYIFMSTQPQLYKFIKEDYPEVYEKIRKRVKQGRWEPEGAMWIEPDCNLISGESFVRQIMFGSRFFEKEFGVKNTIVWLPDVFGFSGAMPQILKKSGIECFMTTKLKWNETNLFPYDTFMWKGIDGSEILTYFTIHHGAFLGPQCVNEVWSTHKQKGLNREVLVPFGYGDGGGGATNEMLENGERLKKGVAGCPKIEMAGMKDFVASLKSSVKGNKKLPKWVGELYFELHRGTYTSIAKNKRYNRKTEFLLQDVELMSVMAKDLAGLAYQQDEINGCWETVLLNQFHDILPGSSIKEVYEESQQQYQAVTHTGNEILKDSVKAVVKNIDLKESSIVVFNQLSFIRNDVVQFDIPRGWSGVEINDHARLCPSQATEDGKVLFYAENVPAKGFKVFTIRQTPQVANQNTDILNSGVCELDNRFFNIKFDKNGNMESIYDKSNSRDVLKPGETGNVLQAFEDLPYANDAWDIAIYYQEKMWEINDIVSIETIEKGPVRSTVRIKRKFLDSEIVQDIYLYNDVQRIDFVSRVDWKEKGILLKAAFPVDLHADKATYDIQFGNIERATHWNTSWDYSKFEVCAHKWADVSEDGYGVSLINDCKYGYDIKDGLMRITLLKSAFWPHTEADREKHEFTYSLYPHAGDWRVGGTVPMSYNLNCPMYATVEEAHSGSMSGEYSLISLDCENVIVDTIKKAEDSEDIIVRLFECYNRRSKVRASMHKVIERLAECDLMENETEVRHCEGSSFEFEIRPYEIRTFKLRLK
jgi:alpha-mannosidase